MDKNKILEVDPTTIRLGWRARGKLPNIDSLAESISDIGQMQPVTVTEIDDGFELIAGHRRLEACKKLGISVRTVVVEVEDEADSLLRQIAENVEREDFFPLELGEALAKHKKIYEALHPALQKERRGRPTKEASARIAAEKAAGLRPQKKPRNFLSVAAEKLGLDDTRIRKAYRLSQNLTDAKKAELRAITDPKKRKRAENVALSDIKKETRMKRLQKHGEQKKAQREADGVIRNRLDLGDCRVVLKEYKKEGLEFDVVLTDPPYGLNWSEIQHSCRADINSEPTWDDLDVGWVLDVEPLLAPDATVIVFCPIEAVGTYQEVFYEAHLEYKGALTWWKTNPAPRHRPGGYGSACEYIVWARKGKPFFKPWKKTGTHESHNCFRSPICQGNQRLDHETQKPLQVINRLLERHAQVGDRLLDPFAGTGTTLVACKRRKIWVAGIEREEKYHTMAKIRLAAT